jgi:hypothetical protein
VRFLAGSDYSQGAGLGEPGSTGCGKARLRQTGADGTNTRELVEQTLRRTSLHDGAHRGLMTAYKLAAEPVPPAPVLDQQARDLLHHVEREWHTTARVGT